MISVSDSDGIAVVRLEHGKVNALDLELVTALQSTFAGMQDARAVVLTGNGRAFSAGVDLKRVVAGGAAYVEAFLPALSDALLSVFTLPRPVVAAVDGHAVAGGAILALACDYRLMAAGRFGVPELAVGVPFPTVALEILRHGGPGGFHHAVLGRETLTAQAALAAGLVDEAVGPDELATAARRHALALAEIPATTFALTKRQIQGPALERIARNRPVHDPAVTKAWGSDEILEKIRAYVDALARP